MSNSTQAYCTTLNKRIGNRSNSVTLFFPMKNCLIYVSKLTVRKTDKISALNKVSRILEHVLLMFITKLHHVLRHARLKVKHDEVVGSDFVLWEKHNFFNRSMKTGNKSLQPRIFSL